jgi:sugar transferase (PEP-CTERM/EpsH1 system associated)
MKDLLYLAHRIPFPPDKGDKIRSFHILRSLARGYRVHLGAFIDDAADEPHVEALRPYCASLKIVPLSRGTATLRSGTGLLNGQPLSFPYYLDGRLSEWVSQVLASAAPRYGFAFSSQMEQYLPAPGNGVRRLVDLVDVDSDKWRQYSQQARGPMRWVYRREARLLAQAERMIVRRSDASIVVSRNERDLLVEGDAELGRKVFAIANGVDTDYFDPAHVQESPFRPGEIPLVFTGAMDYWANVEAVTWFVRAVLPAIRREHPRARFYIVGSNPTSAVHELAAADVEVTGRVPDVRPHLAHATLAIAPLRLARGLQNKVLEAMAMARVVVATPAALRGIASDIPPGVVQAEEAHEFAQAVNRLIAADDRERHGAAARQFVRARFSWERNMAALCALIEGEQSAAVANE